MRFLHGIRRSFLRPVWAPLQRCLPLLALLTCCPEEGDLLPFLNLNQPPGYGDLVPQSGDEDEDGFLPPKKRGKVHKKKGDLPPMRGEEENLAVNSDLPQPQEGHNDGDLSTRGDKKSAIQNLRDGFFPPPEGDEDDADNADLQAPHNGRNDDEDGFLPPTERGGEAINRALQQEDGGDLLPLNGKHGEGNLGKNWYAYDVQFDITDDDGVAESQPHQFPPWVMPISRPRVKMKAHIWVYPTPAHSWEHDGWASTIYYPHHEHLGMSFQLTSTSAVVHPDEYGHDGSPQHPHHDPYSTILAIDLTPQAILIAVYITVRITYSPSFTDSATEYDVNDTFLIPLRGRRCNQWYDEASYANVAAYKLKPMRRRTTMRLLYINKDLLDPG